MMESLVVALTFLLFTGVLAAPSYNTDSRGYISDWSSSNNNEWDRLSGRVQPKCIDIPANLSLCQDIGYRQMRLPNLLEHDTIGEVTQQAKPWVSLSNLKCHPHTKLFLCTLFSPVCLDRPIWPCRSLCEEVKKGCEVRMNKYGYKWPEMVRCDKFPADNDLCISPPNQTTKGPSSGKGGKGNDDKSCQACKQPDTFEGIVDNYCRANFVARFHVQSHSPEAKDTKILIAKKKYYKKEKSLSRKELRSKTFFIEDGASCQCSQLKRKKGKGKYLVMGVKKNNKLIITFLEKFGKTQRRALRKLKKKPNLCQGGIDALIHDQPAPKRSPKNSKNNKQRSKSKRRKDRKSRRKASS